MKNQKSLALGVLTAVAFACLLTAARGQTSNDGKLAEVTGGGSSVRWDVTVPNAGASLIDLGDGIACVEFHAKMNALGGDQIQMVGYAIREVEKSFEGLVVGNQGAGFHGVRLSYSYQNPSQIADCRI